MTPVSWYFDNWSCDIKNHMEDCQVQTHHVSRLSEKSRASDD